MLEQGVCNMKHWLAIFNLDYLLQLTAYLVAAVALTKSFFNGQKIKQHLKLLKMNQEILSLGQQDQAHIQQQFTLINSRLDALDSKFSEVNDQQAQMSQQQQHQGAYKQASKMIQLGASIDEITKDCDITRAEAELLMSLQGFQEEPA